MTDGRLDLMRDVIAYIQGQTSESGYCYSPALLASLLELAKKHGIPVVPHAREKAQRKRRAKEAK